MENKLLDTILTDGLNIPVNLNWEKLKTARQFLEPNPEQTLMKELDDLVPPQKIIKQSILTKLNIEKPLKELPEKPKDPFLGF